MKNEREGTATAYAAHVRLRLRYAPSGWDGCGRALWNLSPVNARALAAQLNAAADEAETVPRFSEEDIEAIADADALDGVGPECRIALRQQLRALRKPRS